MNPVTERRRLVLEALHQWNIAPDWLRLRHHGENTVFEVRNGGERLVARLSGIDLQNAVTVRGELRFIDHCLAQGINGVAAMPTANKQPFAQVRELDDTTGTKRVRIVTLFPFVPGRRVGRKGMTDRFVFHWGELIARLHDATVGFRQTARARRPNWDEIIFQRQLLSAELGRRPWFREQWEAGQEWLATLPANELKLIHADVHEGNFKVIKGQIHLFDFDDSFVGWHAYDLAVVLLRFTGATEREWLDRFRANLLDGYRSVRPLSDEWEARIPGFIRVRRLWIANWLTMRGDIPRLRQYYQDYMLRLRFMVMREPPPFE
jgi:Ser/Thr protein kinase RdoA (MazF antagonist)